MRLLAAIGALAIIVAIALPIYFFGGFYNVAATDQHFNIVTWALERVRIASITHHATDKPAVSLDDPAIVQAGAKEFSEHGCVNCHGAPGATWAKFSEALYPSPPDLAEVGPHRTPEQIFWVVKNGILVRSTNWARYAVPSFGSPKALKKYCQSGAAGG